MIERIQLRNVSSYSPDLLTSINPLQRVNLFYGQNGTGKTTIGNFLQNPTAQSFNECSLEPIQVNQEILVYNHLFVEKNFHESASQPGVFTLNEGNVEAEAAILKAESTIAELEISHEVELQKGITIKESQEQAHEALLASVWQPKRDFDNTALAYCFKSLNTRERLLGVLRTIPFEATPDNSQRLLTEALELQSTSDQELPGITPISLHTDTLETDPIMQEEIIGAGDSYLSEFIKQLGNSDWVKHALQYESASADQCPLCQQILPANFYDEIRKVFDKTYEQRLEQLKGIEKRYWTITKQFEEQCKAPEYQIEIIKLKAAKIHTALLSNLQSLAKKIESPSLVVSLEVTAPLVTELNTAIATEQQRIDVINAKIKNRKKHEEQIRDRFWKWYRAACNGAFTEFEKIDQDLSTKRQQAVNTVKDLRARIKDQRQIITQSRATITNIDQSVENINNWLRILGLTGFTLMKEDSQIPQYRLSRSEQNEDVFRTLSEGEKTLISFLYFLEICNGDLDTESGTIKQDRIIVIDDPISSLSHNFVYDIASLIRSQILSPSNRFKQVIILTHSLFFFHEMIKLLQDSRERSKALFRITKSQYSSISTMEEREVQNDYQAFWQTIKDALQGKTSPNVIPNMMRNILEYYFSFIHQTSSLRKALTDLSDDYPEYRALYRYINRESHSDAVNLNDFGEIDPLTFVDRFKEVFIRTNFESHFDKMME